MLDFPHSRQTFVLQRRINCAFPRVERVLNSADPLGIELLELPATEPFEVVTTWPHHSCRTSGRLRERDGRRIAHVELEFGPWSDDATELLLRPASRRPQRWSGRQQRRYLGVAHAAADDLAAQLEARGRLMLMPTTSLFESVS
jgi:hypothetical protein